MPAPELDAIRKLRHDLSNPLAAILAVLVLASSPAYLSYRRREKRAGKEGAAAPSAAAGA
jgi:hypothetical protein